MRTAKANVLTIFSAGTLALCHEEIPALYTCDVLRFICISVNLKKINAVQYCILAVCFNVDVMPRGSKRYSFYPVLSLLGGPGGHVSPNECLGPPFWFTQNTVFGTSSNDKTTDNDGKKGIITFKHYSPLTFSRFFAKLLAINCCT